MPPADQTDSQPQYEGPVIVRSHVTRPETPQPNPAAAVHQASSRATASQGPMSTVGPYPWHAPDPRQYPHAQYAQPPAYQQSGPATFSARPGQHLLYPVPAFGPIPTVHPAPSSAVLSYPALGLPEGASICPEPSPWRWKHGSGLIYHLIVPDIWKNDLASAPWIMGKQYAVDVYCENRERAWLHMSDAETAKAECGLVAGLVYFANMVTPQLPNNASFLHTKVTAVLQQNRQNLVVGQNFPLRRLIAVVAQSSTSRLQIHLTTRAMINMQHAEVIRGKSGLVRRLFSDIDPRT